MRVRSNEESVQLAQAGRGNFIPIFKPQPGWVYNLIPLVDIEGGQLLYQEKIHKLQFSRHDSTKKFDTARCIDGYVDGTLDPLDPTKKRVKNTGKCVYCTAAAKYSKKSKKLLDEWKSAHPGATEEQITEARREFNSKNVVKGKEDERYYVCAHIEADKIGTNYTLVDDEPVINLVMVKIGASQYDNKLMPIINNIKEVTKSTSLNYCNLRFTYPAGDIKDAGKNLTITLAPKGHDAIWTEHPTWKALIIEEKVKKLEAIPEGASVAPIDTLDEKLYSFIPDSELAAETYLEQKIGTLEGLGGEDADGGEDATSEEGSGIANLKVDSKDIAEQFQIQVEA